MAQGSKSDPTQMPAVGFWLALVLAAVGPIIAFNLPTSLSPQGVGLAVGQGVVALVFALAFYLARNRSESHFKAQRTAILIAAAIAGLIGFGGYYGRSQDVGAPLRPVAGPAPARSADDPEIRVVASRQDSEGVTQDQLSPAFLNNFEAYTLQRVNVLAAQAAKDQGGTGAAPVITSSGATYVDAGGRKLAVLRLEGSDKSSQVMVAGIVGTELVRVLCARTSLERVPLSYGPCHDKVKEAFGVELSVGK